MNLEDVCVVVVGRNEGQRLLESLRVLSATEIRTVYVDSGSRDGSVDVAKRLGIDVIALDDSCPHTAARGRNAGFEYLTNRFPHLRFVQFLDGDCVIARDWLNIAVRELRADDELVMVCGLLRERFPERSLYNRLCEMEWNACPGEAKSCGGNCMVRLMALSSVGGFDPSLIAGEEPELCWRLRRAGGKILRLSAEMGTHDAALHSFGQWWKRQIRAGHAAAENADLHGRADRSHYVRDLTSDLAYGILVPTAAGFTAYVSWFASLLLLMSVYSWLFLRIQATRRRRGDSSVYAALFAAFTVLGKFPQTLGVVIYIWRRKLLNIKSRPIEYKEINRTGVGVSRD